MSLGTIEFDKEYKATGGMYSQKGPDLFVRGTGLVASFNESAKPVEGAPNSFDDSRTTHFVLDAAETDIKLVAGDQITVPFTYEEVDALLAQSRKQDSTVNFRTSNLVELKKNIPAL